MKSLEKNYHNIFNLFLMIIPVSFISMKLANILVITFVVFNLLFYKKLVFNKAKIKLLAIIALPLILDILFFWNNSNLLLTLKATEKHLLFLIFPVLIIGYSNKINFVRLLNAYVTIMIVVLSILLIRYIFLYPEHVSKYISGIHLWEMGYHFTNSFGIHAPWLNMHLAFVCVSSFYLLFTLKTNKLKVVIIYFFQFIISLFFLLYVNTRVAIVSAFFGFIIILTFYFLRNQRKNQIIKKGVILFIFLIGFVFGFTKAFPYTIEKFTSKSFANMDMVGRLDEFENPEDKVFSALVTRVSIWKSTFELANKSFFIGYGAADAKEKLFSYYKETNQKFLYKYKFPVHNQFLDYFLKYGIIGFISVFVFIFYIGYLGVSIKQPLILSFAMLFFLSNLTDDFLILYSGISFSSFWFSIFGNYKINNN